MKKDIINHNIPSELIAAFLDGNTTGAESLEIISSLCDDPELREIMRISQEVDEELGLGAYRTDILPLTAMAASCGEENSCSIECEKFILNKRGIPFDEHEILSNALKNKWLKKDGTALHNIGRHLENNNLRVERRFHCELADIEAALASGADVIAVVDGGELIDYGHEEKAEDIFIGHIPDHSVVILSCEACDERITIFDPNSPNREDEYTFARFSEAWADSKNYLVIINTKDMKEYIPNPLDLSDVVLTEDLSELREAIAENAHEIWAAKRQSEGWTYGPQRDDRLKQTPDMVPYKDLLDSEKQYDREMAMQTIKLLQKLGYDLIKREDTELYKLLKERMTVSDQQFECRRCHHPIYRHQVFCDNCGLELNMDWNEK